MRSGVKTYLLCSELCPTIQQFYVTNFKKMYYYILIDMIIVVNMYVLFQVKKVSDPVANPIALASTPREKANGGAGPILLQDGLRPRKTL